MDTILRSIFTTRSCMTCASGRARVMSLFCSSTCESIDELDA